MDENRERTPPEEQDHHETACPLCLLMNTLSRTKRKHGSFFHHLTNAQIELLQAFKSLIDQQISCLEGKSKGMSDAKRATKIEVE